MQRRLSQAPCPTSDSDSRGRHEFRFSVDDTTQLEFTAQFHNSLRDVKPRRRLTALRPSSYSVANFSIHEDDFPSKEDRSGALGENVLKASTLSRPPQRIGRGLILAQPQVLNPRKTPAFSTREIQADEIQRKPVRRPSIAPESSHDTNSVSMPGSGLGRISKPPRRGTIYIPTDDTTMPSVYMGIFSPIKNAEVCTTAADEGWEQDLTGIAAQMARKRGPRKSLVIKPPKRGPLQQSLQIAQESSDPEDRPGLPSGKENVPPSLTAAKMSIVEKDHSDMRRKPRHRKSTLVTNAECGTALATRQQSRNRAIASCHQPPCSRSSVVREPKKRPAWNTQPPLKITVHPKLITAPSTFKVETEMGAPPPKEWVPSRFNMPKVAIKPTGDVYPMLAEDICHPELYENDWLSYQELAITQLLNNLFSITNKNAGHSDLSLLRIRTLEVYQTSSFVSLHQRLQASIMYGALSPPQDVLTSQAPRLRKDLSLKSAFLDLWLQSFDLVALKTALEVVVGRECALSNMAVKSFLEVFLIRNEDSQPDSGVNLISWSYQRTFLRSMMVVQLLDYLRTQTTFLSGRLFLASSLYKTTTSFVQALIHLLNPSVGDVVRALSHLEYRLCHSQYPLEEYQYRISNLAVDMRDGVRLTRLVELLLYRSVSPHLIYEHDHEITATISMPTGEVLDLINGQQQWPLSQHLKFRCLSRATKLHNVQLALSALSSIPSMAPVLRSITAADFVDGFREKTVALLWGLVGKWGLGGLIDWDDVRCEIHMLERAHLRPGEDVDDEDEDTLDSRKPGFETYKHLLKRWARAVAVIRGLEVNNLTTSFTDGRVFGAIVDQYAVHLTRASSDHSQAKTVPSTEQKLLDIGCSQQFAELFAQPAGAYRSTVKSQRFFDRDFTLAALAFMCSRLLSASKTARKAIVIQRAWRRRWARVELQRRLTKRHVARCCAAVVLQRQRVSRAERVIWQAWTRYRGTRKGQKDWEESAVDVWLTL